MVDPLIAKARVPQYTKGTCEWLLTNPVFQRWLSEPTKSFMWIKGAPGHGKTVLSSFLIDKMHMDSSVAKTLAGTVYFFFSDDRYAFQRTANGLLRAVLYQIIRSKPPLIIYAVTEFRQKGLRAFEELSILWRICTQCFDDPILGNTICILDALDECVTPGRNQLLRYLSEYHTRGFKERNVIKFFVTSRPEISIEEFLGGLDPFLIIDLQTTISSASRDIETFINSQIFASSTFARWPERRKRQLRDRLVNNAERNFLWVSLTLEKFVGEINISDAKFEDKLNKSPGQLEEYYRGILRSVPLIHRDNTKVMLGILVAAKNPLNALELGQCWAVHLSHSSIRDVDNASEWDIYRTVGLLCGQLVRWEISTDDKEFTAASDAAGQASVPESLKNVRPMKCRLVHQSVKDFLMHTKEKPRLEWYHLRPYEIAKVITERCVAFLSLHEFSTVSLIKSRIISNDLTEEELTYKDDISEPEALRRAFRSYYARYPFLRYAFHNWAYHLRSFPSFDLADDFVLDFYKGNKTIRALWLGKMLRLTNTELQDKKYSVPPAALCAYNGHISLMSHLFLGAEDVTVPLGFSPLYAAILGKQIGTVRWLLAHNANIEAEDDWGRRPLHLAARRNDLEILTTLLLHKPDPDAIDHFNKTPLQAAQELGLEVSVSVLASYERAYHYVEWKLRGKTSLDDVDNNEPSETAFMEAVEESLLFREQSVSRGRCSKRLEESLLCREQSVRLGRLSEQPRSYGSSESSDERRSLSTCSQRSDCSRFYRKKSMTTPSHIQSWSEKVGSFDAKTLSQQS